jgi:hypothetical protein
MMFNTKSRSKKYGIICEKVRIVSETPSARVEIITGSIRLHWLITESEVAEIV